MWQEELTACRTFGECRCILDYSVSLVFFANNVLRRGRGRGASRRRRRRKTAAFPRRRHSYCRRSVEASALNAVAQVVDSAIRESFDGFEGNLPQRAPGCSPPAQRSLPLLCFQMGGGTISGNRARPSKVYTFKHQIPAWELQYPQEIPQQRDHIDTNCWGVICEYSGHGGRRHS